MISQELALLAIEQIKKAGCEYGDIRIGRYHKQNLNAQDHSLNTLQDNLSTGFGIRVLWKGSWGFSASYHKTPEEIIKRVNLAVEIAKGSHLTQQTPIRLTPVESYRDSYITPIEINPFEVSIDHKTNLLLTLTDRLLSYENQGIKKANSFLSCNEDHKIFASTEGSLIEQTLYRTYVGYSCTAVLNGDSQSRHYSRPPLNKGYEHIAQDDLLANVDRVAQEAIEKVQAKPLNNSYPTTLILKPSHLWLTIHESVGHPTELDRVYGYESNFAGTSFATTNYLNTLQYASPFINFKADRTQIGGRSTSGYDDEGVKSQEWYVVKEGILVDYLTDRETAYRLGRESSNGSSFADHWSSIPMVRIPNLGLEAGKENDPHTATLQQMIADTEEGILIDGEGSFSIDQQRRNFQFGGDAFWEIKQGKVVGMLKNITYQSMTTEFWNKVDRIGTEKEWEQWGTNMCGKGEPIQIAQMTHGSVPIRVRNIQVRG